MIPYEAMYEVTEETTSLAHDLGTVTDRFTVEAMSPPGTTAKISVEGSLGGHHWEPIAQFAISKDDEGSLADHQSGVLARFIRARAYDLSEGAKVSVWIATPAQAEPGVNVLR
jgi:hypothetical protein